MTHAAKIYRILTGAIRRCVGRLVGLRHRLAHHCGLNSGKVETWHARNGKLMVGFRCECGELSGIHPANVTLIFKYPYDENNYRNPEDWN